jgi:cytoskeletal protein CcmA (bactofilin family)
MSIAVGIRADSQDGASIGTSSYQFSDLYLADGAVISLGDDADVTLTHYADNGVLVNSTRKIYFEDGSNYDQYIGSAGSGVTAIAAPTEVDITATTIDINGNADISGTLALGGNADFNGDLDVDGTSNLDNTDIDGTLVVDGSNISLDSTSTLNIDNSNTSNGVTIATATSGVPISLGHSTSETTVNDNLTVSGNATVSGNLLVVGDSSEVKADNLVVDNPTIAMGLTNGSAPSADSGFDLGLKPHWHTGSGAKTAFLGVDVSTSASAPKLTYIPDASFSSDVVSGTAGTIVADLEGDVTGDLTGTSDLATSFTVSANNSADETVYPVFVDGATGTQGAETDTGLTYNPSSGMLTISGELDAGSLDISGNADIDGTLEADAITVNDTALATYIRDTVGTNMVSSNTETGITVTYDTSNDNLDFAVDAAQTGITSLFATDIKIGEDDQTKIDFETADEIHFYANNTEQVYLADNIFGPQSDSDVDLGTTGVRWKDAFVDSIAVTGNGDIDGNLDVDGTTNLDAVDIDGAVQIDSTVTVGANDQGYDIIFYGDTASTNMTWDTSADDLIFNGAARVVVPDGQLVLGSTAVSSTAAELNLIDGGTSRGTTAVASGDGILINDGGTMRMTNVDTVSTYFSSHNVGGGNIVTTGALNSGSITSGFGSIDTGSSTITTTGLISGGSLDIDDVLINGTTIGHTDDTDLITVANGSVTVAGEISVTTLDIGGTDVASTAAELNLLDGSAKSTSSITIADADAFIVIDGTTTKQIPASDLETYMESSLDTLSNVTTVGTLNSGSISSGFGAIDIGTSGLTAGSTSLTGLSLLTGNITNVGDIDVDGTANLDNTDIDGTLTQDGGAVVFNEAGADYDFRIESDDNANIFCVDGSEDKIGIGTATPAELLNIQSSAPDFSIQHDESGSGSEPTFKFKVHNGGPGGAIGSIRAHTGTNAGTNTATLNLQKDGNGGGYFIFYARPDGGSQAEHFRIAADGTLTGTDTDIGSNSDQRLKKNITSYSGSLDLIKELNPVTFEWREPSVRKTGLVRGFLAQDVLNVDPYYVDKQDVEATLLDGEANPEYDYVKDDGWAYTSKLGEKDAMYVSAIKELLSKVESLETKVTALENA